MKNFTDLLAWNIGIELAKEVYELSRSLPREERFGVISQMQRCATSILANLAEGFGRYTYPDKAAKYTISRGECSEEEAFLLIIVALGFVPPSRIERARKLVLQERRLLSGLISACRNQR
jgi:four helix bundle protein